jgi:hypothetical protein
MADQEVICLSDSDDDTEKENNRPKIKSEGNIKSESPEDDEVQVLDGTTLHQPVFHHAGSDDDDELQIVGSTNTVVLPHNRQDCLICRYDVSSGGNGNRMFCRLCFCYVCDKEAGECVDWFEGGRGVCVDDAREEGGEKEKETGNANVVDGEKVKSVEIPTASAENGGDCDANNDSDDQANNDSIDSEKVTAAAAATSKDDADPVKSANTTTTNNDSQDQANNDSNDSEKVAAAAAVTSKDDANSSNTITAASTAAASTTTTTTAATSENTKPHKNHCQATDRGPLKTFWYNMRLAVRAGRDPSSVSNTTTLTSAESERQMMQRYADNYGDALQHAMQEAMNHFAGRRRGRTSSNPPASRRRRTRPRNGSLGPSDHRQRIRAQNMLESLYQNPDSW